MIIPVIKPHIVVSYVVRNVGYINTKQLCDMLNMLRANICTYMYIYVCVCNAVLYQMWTSNIDDILTHHKLLNIFKYKALRLRLWKRGETSSTRQKNTTWNVKIKQTKNKNSLNILSIR